MTAKPATLAWDVCVRSSGSNRQPRPPPSGTRSFPARSLMTSSLPSRFPATHSLLRAIRWLRRGRAHRHRSHQLPPRTGIGLVIARDAAYNDSISSSPVPKDGASG